MRAEISRLYSKAKKWEITPRDAYNFYAKFNNIYEVYDGEIPKIGDVLIGSIGNSSKDWQIKDFGVFTDIINVASVGMTVGFGREYDISGLLHWKKMQKGSPLKNWHRNYSKSFKFFTGLPIIVEIDEIDNKGCSLKEINPYSNLEYNNVINSSDLKVFELFQTELNIYRSFDRKDFNNKNIKNKYTLQYSFLNNCFIVDNELLIPVSSADNRYYATRNFKKVIYIPKRKYNLDQVTKIIRLFLEDNYKNIQCIPQDIKEYFNASSYRYKDGINSSDIKYFLSSKFDIRVSSEYLELYHEHDTENMKLHFFNNIENAEILLETKTLIEQYNSNQKSESSEYEKDLKASLKVQQEQKEKYDNFYKRVLNNTAAKTIDTYLYSHWVNAEGVYKYEKNEITRSFSVYTDLLTNKEYFLIDNKLYLLINNRLVEYGYYEKELDQPYNKKSQNDDIWIGHVIGYCNGNEITINGNWERKIYKVI